MYNIAINGARQLGNRPLQGLKLAKLPMLMQVVDSSTESLAVAKSRYDEVAVNDLIEKIELMTDNNLNLISLFQRQATTKSLPYLPLNKPPHSLNSFCWKIVKVFFRRNVNHTVVNIKKFAYYLPIFMISQYGGI